MSTLEKYQFTRRLRPGLWFADLFIDYVIFALACYLAVRFGWPAYPVSLLLMGIAQHRISVLGHEAAHGLVTRSKRGNYLLGQIFCFWPLLIDIKGYREFHWDHHRHTGEAGADPELPLKEGHYKNPPLSRTQYYVGFLLDLCGASVVEFVNVVMYFFKRSNPAWPISFIVLSASVSFISGYPELFILFMLSKPTTFWAVFRLRVYMEHVGTDDTHRVHLNVFQRALFAPHNIWIHWEHHEHPSVPYWALPDVRRHYSHVPIVSYSDLLFKNQSP